MLKYFHTIGAKESAGNNTETSGVELAHDISEPGAAAPSQNGDQLRYSPSIKIYNKLG